MDFELSEHAQIKMNERGIKLEWIERVLSHPELVEPDRVDGTIEHRIARIPEFGNHALRIIVNTTVKPLRVVTVFFDRRTTLP